MSSHLSLTIVLCRTIILLNLIQQIRTLNSESEESFTGLSDHNNEFTGRHNVHNSRRLSLPQTQNVETASSVENNIKYHQKQGHANAIVKASAGRHKTTHNNLNTHHSQFNFARSEGSPSERTPTPGRCLTCASSQLNQQVVEFNPLPEDVLTKMRIERVKEQILKKLRLTEEPKPPKKLTKDLPIPVTLGETLHKNTHANDGDKDVEDFYGKTEQIIVFPDKTMEECTTFENQNPSSCFLFKLPTKVKYEEIGSVELWVYKLPDPNDRKIGQTFFVNQKLESRTEEDDDDYSEDYNPVPPSSRSRIIDTKSNIRQDQGWLNMNLTRDVTRWLKTSNFQQTLQIGCSTCESKDGSEELGSPIGVEGEKRPFIVINMAGVVKNKRPRRHINCSPGEKDCCRERFVVNFKEIGWDWIIGPESYEAYYCKGSCLSANSLSVNSSRRTSIIQRYLNNHGSNNTAALVPCCTATRMSSISLIYFDYGDNSTGSRTRTETLPNMVVEGCGCL